MAISFKNVNIEKTINKLIEIYAEQEKIKISSIYIEKKENLNE